MRSRRVVAGVGPDTPLAVADAAAAEASLRGLPLYLLSAGAADLVSAAPASSEPPLCLTGLLRRVCTVWPGLTAVARSVTDDPAAALTAASRAACLVVVGRNGRGMGIAGQVAAHALCPTLVVPPDPPPRPDAPVLLGVAVAPDEEPAIGYAFEAAALRRVPVLAVSAAADRLVAESLAGWAAKYPDVTLDRVPRYDVDPARTLVDASALASLVVVGVRRGGAHSSQLLGPVARALIERGACPVAVIPSPYH